METKQSRGVVITEPQKRLKKLHLVGRNSLVVTIHPDLVAKYGLNDLTFFEQVETSEGILMKPRRFEE